MLGPIPRFRIARRATLYERRRERSNLVRVKLLTLDMTAIRDATYGDRQRHGDALRLLDLAERGEVELGVPPQGSLADLRGQFGGELAQRVQGLLARPGVVGLPQVARPSDVTFPSENLLPGKFIDGFDERWDAVAADWHGPGKRPGDLDRWYVESHLLGARDVLLTDDLALRTMCDRLRNEHGLSVYAESLSSYLARWA
jgi:hypothetical protein